MKPNQKDELEKKTDNEFVRKFAEEKYKYGFTTEVHTDIIERGLNEDVIRLNSKRRLIMSLSGNLRRRNINTASPQRCIQTSLSVDLMKMSFV